MKPFCLFAVIATAASPVCGAGSAGSNHAGSVGCASAAVAEVVPADSAAAPYPIADDCAGPFRIGAVIPDNVDGFVVTERTEERTGPEGKTYTITVYTYEIGNEGWVGITPQYDPATGRANDRIGEIFVYSDLFLTDRGIGAMSSIEEFAAAYPDLRIRHAEDEGLFVVETPRLRNVGFLLQDAYYVGAHPDAAPGAPAGPEVADFRKGACFTAIRIGR